MKICPICNRERRPSIGYCDTCMKEYQKKHRQTPEYKEKERIRRQTPERKEYHKAYLIRYNRDKRTPYKELDEKQKEKGRESCRQQYQKTKRENPELIKARKLRYKQKNPNWWKVYYHKNKQKFSEYMKNKFRYDINFRIKTIIRNRINYEIRTHKSRSSIRYLWCTIESFKCYIEDKFEPWMTWENHGERHLDHIIPCYHFDLSNEKEIKDCFHYTNYQPLRALDNLKKWTKLEYTLDKCNK